MVSFSPLSRVVPLPNGRFMAYKRGLLSTYDTWDDPPSGMAISDQVHMASGPISATKRRHLAFRGEKGMRYYPCYIPKIP